MTRLDKWNLLDHRLFYFVHRRAHSRLFYWWARLCSISGDGLIYVAAALGLWRFNLLGPLKLLALGFTIERSVYFFAKPTFRRRRPSAALPQYTALIQPADAFSFPSGHSSAAFLFATCVYLLDVNLSLLAFIWAANIAVSRVMLGVHFISDVVAGALIGVAIAISCSQFVELSQ
ncbi:MAG: phosphatase PAP2 family protein [Moraxellaceae bacterium]|jgi:undecaprenyl-diphosphatase|nr:MAG: phosphatase PAP2 family protein [Moraxellaceae bacterium]